MYKEKDMSDFIQWMKDTGRAKEELKNIIIIDNDKLKKEKKMAWVVKITSEDLQEFCETAGRDIDRVKLLAIY